MKVSTRQAQAIIAHQVLADLIAKIQRDKVGETDEERAADYEISIEAVTDVMGMIEGEHGIGDLIED